MIRRVIAIVALLLLSALPAGAPAATTPEEGSRAFEAGDYAAAERCFRDILEGDEDNPEARFYLGRIALAGGEADSAIAHLREAVEIEGSNSEYRAWLGRAYLTKMQTVSYFEKGMLAGRALDNLKKAVELDPSNIEARITLGGYYLNAPSIAGGSNKKALEQAEEVVKHDLIEGNFMLARIHLKNEEYDQAIEKFETCIEADPRRMELRYHLGLLYQRMERYEEASRTFEEVVEIDPDNGAALYQIGRTAAFSGRNIDRGIECLSLYLEKDVEPGYPGYDGAHWRLGMLYEHRGDLAKAREEYRTAVRLDPGNDKYKESLEMLGSN